MMEVTSKYVKERILDAGVTGHDGSYRSLGRTEISATVLLNVMVLTVL